MKNIEEKIEEVNNPLDIKGVPAEIIGLGIPLFLFGVVSLIASGVEYSCPKREVYQTERNGWHYQIPADTARFEDYMNCKEVKQK